jgi:hypothetical protein
LLEDAAVDVKQKTVMIMKGFCKPKDSLTCVEKKSLQALKANVERTVLPADKGNAVLSTADYNHKIAALLKDQAYRKLKKEHIESMEHKTILLLKRSSPSEQICQEFQLQGLRPSVSTIRAPAYHLTKHLALLLCPHIGSSPHCFKNSGGSTHWALSGLDPTT